MLLRFRFSNFKSFRDQQELSLVADSRLDRSDVLSSPAVKEPVLPACAIYGANASGKSNVLQALRFVERAVLQSHRRWEPGSRIPLQAFRGNQGDNQESTFELDFIVGSTRFQFGFKSTGAEIKEEWLQSYPNGRKQTLYNRTAQNQIAFGRNLGGDNKTIASLVRPNSLFLSAAAQNNHEALLPVYGWFQRSIHFLLDTKQSHTPQTIRMCADEASRRELSDLMSFADLGIVSLSFEKDRVEMTDKVRSAMDALMTALEIPESARADARVPEISENVRLIHKFGDVLIPFDFDDESQGTLAYFAVLGPIIRALEGGSTLVIDELDSSLHPSLTSFLVRAFSDKASNPKSAQLIFNTHDINLLSDGALKKDQIWFTEKDRQGVSHLFPLTDFKMRADENFGKRYLQGRFGAVPFINSERLIDVLGIDATAR
jgi:AAA15 family ATPase/GTPase